MDFKQKYLKYKEKYQSLKRMFGGAEVGDKLVDTTTNESVGTITRVLADKYELSTSIGGVPNTVLKSDVNDVGVSGKRYNILKKSATASGSNATNGSNAISGSASGSASGTNATRAAATPEDVFLEAVRKSTLTYPAQVTHICACGCGEVATQKCGGCLLVNYVDSTHQRRHWPTHRPHCNPAKKQLAAVLKTEASQGIEKALTQSVNRAERALQATSTPLAGETSGSFLCRMERASYKQTLKGMLLGSGYTIEKDMSGRGDTPLLLYCGSGTKEEIMPCFAVAAIDLGANVNVRNSTGVTPLLAACRNGLLQVVEALLALVPGRLTTLDVQDANGNTGLMLACENGNREIAMALIAAGANVQLKNRAGKTALEVCNMSDVAAALRAKGAK